MARTGHRGDGREVEGLAAGWAGHGGLDDVAARVAESDGWPGLWTDPAVAPRGERHQDGYDLSPGCGEPVVVAGRTILIRAPLDHAPFDQMVETTGEEVARHAEIVGQFIEAGQPQVQIAQHQRCPWIADHVERPCHRAVHRAEIASSHVRKASGLTI